MFRQLTDNHSGWCITSAWVFHVFKLLRSFGKISETHVIPIFNHSCWCINDAWVFHLNPARQIFSSPLRIP